MSKAFHTRPADKDLVQNPFSLIGYDFFASLNAAEAFQSDAVFMPLASLANSHPSVSPDAVSIIPPAPQADDAASGRPPALPPKTPHWPGDLIPDAPHGIEACERSANGAVVSRMMHFHQPDEVMSHELILGANGLRLVLTAQTLFVEWQPQAGAVQRLSLQTLVIREHNRWVDDLAAEHPDWSDADLFQAARARVETVIEAILFNEILPLLVRSNPTGVVADERDVLVVDAIATEFVADYGQVGLELMPDYTLCRRDGLAATGAASVISHQEHRELWDMTLADLIAANAKSTDAQDQAQAFEAQYEGDDFLERVFVA